MNRPGEETMIRYFRGQCTPEEEKIIEIFIAAGVDREYIATCLREAFYNLENEHDPAIDRKELDRAWASLVNRQKQARITPLKPRSRWYAYAAAVVFFIFCGYVFTLLNDPARAPDPAEIAWRQFSAGAGQIKKIQLPDSSQVTLFAGAIVDLPENFGDKERNVKLTGRAFFEITHNAEKPFFVTTKELTTKVLGTTFEVNDPGGDDAENIITLHSGKVSIQKQGKEIARLSPNQQIRFQKSTGQYQVVDVDAAYTIAWMRGELDYDQADLQAILHDLENWYGIKIRSTSHRLLTRKITISFKGLPIERALKMLSKSAGFSYSMEGRDQITIKERRSME